VALAKHFHEPYAIMAYLTSDIEVAVTLGCKCGGISWYGIKALDPNLHNPQKASIRHAPT
jgi:hypothetical protein